MSKRDQRLAETKYKGRESASEKNDRKSKESKGGESQMDAMRRAISAPRTQESKDRAAAYRRSLPRLG